jgi:hypothetical protein
VICLVCKRAGAKPAVLESGVKVNLCAECVVDRFRRAEAERRAGE